MSVYLRAKFEVSSIILTSFRQGGEGNSLPRHTSKQPLKRLPRLGLRKPITIIITYLLYFKISLVIRFTVVFLGHSVYTRINQTAHVFPRVFVKEMPEQANLPDASY